MLVCEQTHSDEHIDRRHHWWPGRLAQRIWVEDGDLPRVHIESDFLRDVPESILSQGCVTIHVTARDQTVAPVLRSRDDPGRGFSPPCALRELFPNRFLAPPAASIYVSSVLTASRFVDLVRSSRDSGKAGLMRCAGRCSWRRQFVAFAFSQRACSDPLRISRFLTTSDRNAWPMLKKQLLDSSRGRIVTLLRGGGLTADDIASKLGVTRSAIRAQITGMERDGVVRRAGQRPGTTRPSHVFELTPEVEQLLSSAYIPLLTQLVHVFASGLPAHQLEAMLRQAGKSLADELSRGKRPTGIPRRNPA
jgi:DNA-binding MarR family transcriptional regulator